MPLITGFTNGVFDTLHRGHIHFLATASLKCDSLIVAVDGDARVRALKGEGRPVDPLATRLDNVWAYLDGKKDRVFVFDDEEELRWLIGKVKPDVIFKGGDYTIERVIGRELVERVCIIPRLPGFSTSEIIEAQK